jgi:hypothetical protein
MEEKSSSQAVFTSRKGRECRQCELTDDDAISQSTGSVLFRNDSAEDIYNADETGLFWKLLPTKTLATKFRYGEKIQKDRGNTHVVL